LETSDWPSGFWNIFSSDPEFEVPKALPTKHLDSNHARIVFLANLNADFKYVRINPAKLNKMAEEG